MGKWLRRKFNGMFRDELPNREIFYSLPEAQVIIEQWRRRLRSRPNHAVRIRLRQPLEAILGLAPAHFVRRESLHLQLNSWH